MRELRRDTGQQAEAWLNRLDGRLAWGRVPFSKDGLQYAPTVTKGV